MQHTYQKTNTIKLNSTLSVNFYENFNKKGHSRVRHAPESNEWKRDV